MARSLALGVKQICIRGWNRWGASSHREQGRCAGGDAARKCEELGVGQRPEASTRFSLCIAPKRVQRRNASTCGRAATDSCNQTTDAPGESNKDRPREGAFGSYVES
jgi:hypothetical protein